MDGGAWQVAVHGVALTPVGGPRRPGMGSPRHSRAARGPVFSLRWRNLVRSHSHLHTSCSPGLGAADTQAGL